MVLHCKIVFGLWCMMFMSSKQAALRHAPDCCRLLSPIVAGQAILKSFVSSNSSSSDTLVPGAIFTLTKRFTVPDVVAFVALSGDHNPIHTQAEAARAVGLPGPILPGMLSASLFPAIIGSNFPGAVYLSQTLKFRNYVLVRTSIKSQPGRVPLAERQHTSTGQAAWRRWLSAQVGDSLTATLRVEKASGSRVSFLTQCRKTDSGELVVEGTALALLGQQQPQE